MASAILHCGPVRLKANSLAMTLADARVSQVWARRVSLSTLGAMTKIELGRRSASFGFEGGGDR